jgi:hypothetical protein
MPKSRYPYTIIRGSSTPAFPEGKILHMPLLLVELRSPRGEITCNALVDSGALFCSFPISFAKPLALDLTHKSREEISGVGGKSAAYFHDIQVAMEGASPFSVYAAFTEGLEHARIGLLGQSGFFDRFEVCFDLNKGCFEIEK